MRGKIVFAGLIMGLTGLCAHAQGTKPPFPNDIYCSGVITTEKVPDNTFIVTGEESNVRITFDVGDMVYLNKGSDDGAKVGDEFSIVRPVEDHLKTQWTQWQFDILRQMGTLWADEGRVKIVELQNKTSVAVVEHQCDLIQRGDIALPFAPRPDLTLKPLGQFDRFAPPDGKSMAMIITGKNFRNELGNNDIVYVNLGAAQGVQAGQYFRIFRYTGTHHETAYQTPRYAFDLQYAPPAQYGFGAVSQSFNWSNTPREVLGEGIVLRTGPNASTVLITFGTHEIYSGDYVEIE